MSKPVGIAAFALAVGCFVLTPIAMSAGDAPTGQAAKLRTALTVNGVKRHMIALQAIANQHDSTRAAGTPGYDASVTYVVDQLRAAGYEPQLQMFDFDFFRELATPAFQRTAPTPRTYLPSNEFFTMMYSGSGNVTANIQEVRNNQFPPGPMPNSSSAGCTAAAFVGFIPGNVALIQRGFCPLHDKAANAQTAGASAVVVFNEGQPGRTAPVQGTLGTTDVTIPVIGTSFASGEELHNLLVSGAVTVHIATSTISEVRQTVNILAETPSGDPNRVVVQGSHLDSVPAGPGINDNGSGSAYNLESAIQLANNNIKPRNKIRFAWWGAEELGLLGSIFYVNTLSDEEFNKIMLNLNYDMLASANFVRFVYNGDSSDITPPGTAEIEKVFNDYFASKGLATAPTPLDGRSDHFLFVALGVPAGGLFSGAEGIKTPEQAAVFGGVPGEAFDRCYHQACDTLSNVNDTVLDQMSDAGATALVLYALTKDPVRTTTLSKEAARAALNKQEYRGPYLQR